MWLTVVLLNMLTTFLTSLTVFLVSLTFIKDVKCCRGVLTFGTPYFYLCTMKFKNVLLW